MLHHKSKFIFLTFTVLSSLFFASPAKALIPLTVPVFDPLNYQTNERQTTAYYLKEFVVYPLIRKVANALENKLVNKVSGQIAGINGAPPSFITNWRNHILDSQARGNDVFRSVLADTKLCPYFGDELKKAFGADKFIGAIAGAIVKNSAKQVVYENKTNVPGLPSFQFSANCGLPTGFDVTAFQKDFKQGGWAAWDKLIQPQNNFYGAYALALQEQQNQVAIEKQSSQDSSIAGQGFLSQKLGSGTGTNIGTAGLGPTGCTTAVTSNKISDNLVEETKVPRCVFQGKVVTPEQILGETAVAAIDKKLGRIGGSTQITDILLSLFDAVLDATTNKIANYIGQATYDRPPNSSGGYQETSDAENQRQDANVGNAQNQGEQIRQQCLNDCRAQQQDVCAELPVDEQAACLTNPSNICNQRCGVQ